jgi:hypothetical protein
MEIVELYGSAPRSGRGGRRFKSCHSDHYLADTYDLFATPCATPWRLGVGGQIDVALSETQKREKRTAELPDEYIFRKLGRPWL